MRVEVSFETKNASLKIGALSHLIDVFEVVSNHNDIGIPDGMLLRVNIPEIQETGEKITVPLELTLGDGKVVRVNYVFQNEADSPHFLIGDTKVPVTTVFEAVFGRLDELRGLSQQLTLGLETT